MSKFYTLTIQDHENLTYFFTIKKKFECVNLRDAEFFSETEINNLEEKCLTTLDPDKWQLDTLHIVEISITFLPPKSSNKLLKHK
jgi:hypothetical protein